MSEKISADVKIMNRKARSLRRRVINNMTKAYDPASFKIVNGVLEYQNKTIKSNGRNMYFFGDDPNPTTLRGLIDKI